MKRWHPRLHGSILLGEAYGKSDWKVVVMVKSLSASCSIICFDLSIEQNNLEIKTIELAKYNLEFALLVLNDLLLHC